MSNLKYLVGVDGSEWSERAAEQAVSIAVDTGASVLFMCVTNWSDYTMMTVEAAMNRPVDKAEEEKHALVDVLNPLVEKYRGSGVAIETAHTWGDPRYVLREKARDIHADIIFMGRRGRSKLTDLVMGSVSNALVHSAHVPVLLVP
jgi:nucleotide-binding universal stress UspA family protein